MDEQGVEYAEDKGDAVGVAVELKMEFLFEFASLFENDMRRCEGVAAGEARAVV